jgi:hypothetical protein
VLITGGGFEFALRAGPRDDVSLTTLVRGTFGDSAVVDDEIISVARPTQYSLLARVGGVLGLDGRCLVVDDPVGRRSAVIWPAGTRWVPAEGTVVHAGGARIRLGDTFYTAGGHLSARHVNTTRGLPPTYDRAVACGHKVGGNMVLLGPSEVDVEE